MAHRVVVTGWGVLSPIGSNAEQHWANLIRGGPTRDHRKVQRRVARDHCAVNRHSFPRQHDYGLANRNGPNLPVLVAAVFQYDRDAPGHHSREGSNCISRPSAHCMIERPSGQQEKEKGGYGVEIRMRPIRYRIIRAEKESQQDADADRHVHVRVASS